MFQRLMPLALVNVVVHIVGLLFAAFGMRPGSPLTPFPERMHYLARYPLGWSMGWGVWMVCDFAVVAFIFQAARRLRSDLALLAVGLVVLGAAFDLACDSVFIAVLPRLAADAMLPNRVDVHYSVGFGKLYANPFLTIERVTNTISLIIANGLITLSAAVFTLALIQRIDRGRVIAFLGAAILIFGLLLSAAGFMSRPWLTEWVTGPTIVSFCAWCVVVAYRLDRLEPAR
ncbi:MAG TPA: hypothetical protein VKS79_04415 [Gemmataceae bacterium]|nr:hypothetical protein [Gemmataceae bacterium]